MTNSATLTLILTSGAAEVLSELREPVVRNWLARAAARGSLKSFPREKTRGSDHLDWEWQLLAALGLQDRADAFASAPLCHAAEDATGGFWIRAEPMHFAAGLSRVDAVALRGAAALDVDERQQLASTLGSYVRSVGLQWDDASEWLIGFPRALDVQTRQPYVASSTELETAMPTGADSRELRRLMTELQMVLHEHPVNESRTQKAVPTANAVWLWGAGAFTEGQQPSRRLPRIFGDSAFVRGLGRALSYPIGSVQNLDQLLRDMQSTDAIATMDVHESTDFHELWLLPLQRALAEGRLQKLNIGLDRWQIELTRASRWRLWRRDLPIEQWNAA